MVASGPGHEIKTIQKIFPMFRVGNLDKVWVSKAGKLAGNRQTYI